MTTKLKGRQIITIQLMVDLDESSVKIIRLKCEDLLFPSVWLEDPL